MAFKQLYPYQERYLAGLPKRAIMNAELGTGKTAMSICHYIHQAYPEPLLIVGPASKIRTGDWEREIDEVFRAYNLEQPEITLISYEKLRLMDNQTRRPRWWHYVAYRNGGKKYAVIGEEIHACKNAQSKQSKAMYEITRDADFFIGLTGTMMANGWIDFSGYSKMFDFTSGITEFKNTYCSYQTYKGYPELIGYRNVDRLEKQLNQIAFRLTREQASELPSRRMLGVKIEMDKKTQKLYYTLKLTRKDPRTGEMLDNSTRLLSVLRQATTNSRLDHLISIVNDTSDNIVIFYNYISERQAILKELAKTEKKILRYDGDQHDDLPAPDASVSNTVLLAHYKSASTGLNLQFANVTIYFSPSYSYQEFEQSVGRTHRTGQTKKCLYYLFRVEGTVDFDIWDCLQHKRSFSEQLLQEKEKSLQDYNV